MCDSIMHFHPQEPLFIAPDGKDFHVMDEIPILLLHSHFIPQISLSYCPDYLVLSLFARIVLTSLAASAEGSEGSAVKLAVPEPLPPLPRLPPLPPLVLCVREFELVDHPAPASCDLK
jgi:hypothetical protein